MKIVVNFWAWSTICTDMKNGIVNGFNRCCSDYGKAYASNNEKLLDDTKQKYYFVGEAIKETEKAVQFEVPCFTFNSRCDITNSYKWRLWIPKKCLYHGDFEFVENGYNKTIVGKSY